MLYLVGTGIAEGDLTEKAKETIKKCEKIYAEDYTNRFIGDFSSIEKVTGKIIKKIDREKIESDFLVEESSKKDVALLVPGDPLAATTHFQLILDAKEKKVDVEVVHATSIYAAIAATGLYIYKFGRSTTIADWALSPYEIIAENKKRGLHTLILLDTRSGNYMKLSEALEILEKSEDRLKQKIFLPETKLLVCSCLGSGKQKIVYASINKLQEMEPPVTFVLPGDLNFKEEEAMDLWKLD